jgi:hypothetical protein
VLDRRLYLAAIRTAPEKVAESILEDFFTIALDWEIGNLNNQLRYADLVPSFIRLPLVAC